MILHGPHTCVDSASEIFICESIFPTISITHYQIIPDRKRAITDKMMPISGEECGNRHICTSNSDALKTQKMTIRAHRLTLVDEKWLGIKDCNFANT